MYFMNNFKGVINFLHMAGIIPFRVTQKRSHVNQFTFTESFYIYFGRFFILFSSMVYLAYSVYLKYGLKNVITSIDLGIVFIKSVTISLSFNLIGFVSFWKKKEHQDLLKCFIELDRKLERYEKYLDNRKRIRYFNWEMGLYACHGYLIACPLTMYLNGYYRDLNEYLFWLFYSYKAGSLVLHTIYLKFYADIILDYYDKVIVLMSVYQDPHPRPRFSIRLQSELLQFISEVFDMTDELFRLYNQAFGFVLLILITNSLIYSASVFYVIVYWFYDNGILLSTTGPFHYLNFISALPFAFKILFLGGSFQRTYDKVRDFLTWPIDELIICHLSRRTK